MDSREVDLIDLSGDKEVVSGRTFACVVNKEHIRGLLNFIPYTQQLDLVIVYRIIIELRDEQVVTMMITNKIMKALGFEAEELHKVAMTNTEELFPHLLMSLEEVIPECYKVSDANCPIYVLTNCIRTNGAAALFTSQAVKHFAVKNRSNLYIIPSSIHEVLIICEKESAPLNYLFQMVKEINEEVVEEKEILSNNIYFYDLEKDELRVLESGDLE